MFDPSRSHPTVAHLISDLKGAPPRSRAARVDARVPGPPPWHSCVFPSASHAHPLSLDPSAADGVLDELDDVAAGVAARKVSLLDAPSPSRELPHAPQKPRNTSILRRNLSATDPEDADVLRRRASAPRQTARRLTWTDARDVAGRLEHVHLFDRHDAMATCSFVAPDSSPGLSRRASTGSSVSLTSPVSLKSAASASASGSASLAAVAITTGDPALAETARRIAAQLLKYESLHGDCRGMPARNVAARCSNAKSPPRVSARVQGAAAAAKSARLPRRISGRVRGTSSGRGPRATRPHRR